ncbi:hypothetical protein MAE30S32_39020 [Microcystis aeruginosa 11-30S32]|uniref:Uncharacterized protein n=1 Tax=Microcystis aeruginosa 11-30S32 TaxID=2358142 RepID=A0A510PNX9_MICAE|nr:hypothetical protein MAE30S32_39020 [Microcystis aeruginosa 11-30S32]
MFNFGGSSKIRFDGFYYSEPYEEHFGEVDFLRFYRDGSCIKHWTQSNDIDFIMQYIDVPAARHGQNTLSGWAGTFSVNQGDLFINLLGGSGGKEFYEGVILPNGDLKTNWQLTPFMNLAVVTNYIFGFVLIVFGSDSAIADCVESL